MTVALLPFIEAATITLVVAAAAIIGSVFPRDNR